MLVYCNRKSIVMNDRQSEIGYLTARIGLVPVPTEKIFGTTPGRHIPAYVFPYPSSDRTAMPTLVINAWVLLTRSSIQRTSLCLCA